MATANPLWGAPRIHGELRTLGIDVSERTVSRLVEPHSRPPSQTWRTFLTNHLASAASVDSFTVPTLIVHFNITDHPTATWSAQQLVDAFREDTAPRWLHQDRDCIYGDVFQRRIAGMGIAEVVSAPASPEQNPYVERLIGSNAARVSRSGDRSQRSASAPHARALQPELSPESDAPWPRERHARSATGL
jgi:putative transposase